MFILDQPPRSLENIIRAGQASSGACLVPQHTSQKSATIDTKKTKGDLKRLGHITVKNIYEQRYLIAYEIEKGKH